MERGCPGKSLRPVMDFMGMRNKLPLNYRNVGVVSFCSVTWPVYVEAAVLLELWNISVSVRVDFGPQKSCAFL